jgi:uncharacterized protein YjiS (DUF1127 family)
MITIFDTWRARRRLQKTHRQLHGLSDHTLSDIGLTRDSIALVGRNGLPNEFDR